MAILCPIAPTTTLFIVPPSYAPTVETPVIIGPDNCDICPTMTPVGLVGRCSIQLSYGRKGVEGEGMPRSQATSQAMIPARPHIFGDYLPPPVHRPSGG